jgi:hypothetical protein
MIKGLAMRRPARGSTPGWPNDRNQPRRTLLYMKETRGEGMNSKLMVPALLVGMVVALGVGVYIGRQTSVPVTPVGAPPTAGAADPAPPAPKPPVAPQNEGLSPEAIAKAKNVPAVLEDPAGDYQIVAVIEGAEANSKLTQNLQVIGAQRQRLLALTQQYDRLPAEAVQQRELVAGEVMAARRTLEQNLRFMAQGYGYSLQFNYRLVPHAASLHKVTKGADDKPVSELAHQFSDAKTYEAFQKLREEYLMQTVAEVKAAAGEEDAAVPGEPELVDPEAPLADPVAADEPDFEPSEELKAMERKLIAEYDFDPKLNYQVNLEKTALYARASQ